MAPLRRITQNPKASIDQVGSLDGIIESFGNFITGQSIFWAVGRCTFKPLVIVTNAIQLFVCQCTLAIAANIGSQNLSKPLDGPLFWKLQAVGCFRPPAGQACRQSLQTQWPMWWPLQMTLSKESDQLQSLTLKGACDLLIMKTLLCVCRHLLGAG